MTIMMNIECLFCGGKDFTLLIDQSRDNGDDKNYICETCAFIAIYPRPDKLFHEKEYKEGGFSVSARGDSAPSKHMLRISDWQANNRLRILKKFTGELIGKKVIDVGCGTGSFLKILGDYGNDVIGLEPDDIYTESVRKEFGIDIRNKFLEEYVTSEKYDLVSSFHVIEHVEDPNAFLQHCRNLLSDDGILYLECPSVDRIYGDKVEFFFWYAHLNTFSAKTLTGFLAKNGFEVLQQGWNRDFISVIAKKTDYPDDHRDYFDDAYAIRMRVRKYNSLIRPKIRKVFRELRVFKNKVKAALFNIH